MRPAHARAPVGTSEFTYSFDLVRVVGFAPEVI